MGDRFGITTLAPARMPFSRPFGSIVPSAVVEGKRIFGFMSLISERRKQVCSTLPAGNFANGVSYAE